jgi:hypothetical protein
LVERARLLQEQQNTEAGGGLSRKRIMGSCSEELEDVQYAIQWYESLAAGKPHFVVTNLVMKGAKKIELAYFSAMKAHLRLEDEVRQGEQVDKNELRRMQDSLCFYKMLRTFVNETGSTFLHKSKEKLGEEIKLENTNEDSLQTQAWHFAAMESTTRELAADARYHAELYSNKVQVARMNVISLYGELAKVNEALEHFKQWEEASNRRQRNFVECRGLHYIVPQPPTKRQRNE